MKELIDYECYMGTQDLKELAKKCYSFFNQEWNGENLEWDHVWNVLKMNKYKSKWVVTDDTPRVVLDFLSDFGYYSPFGFCHGDEGMSSSQLAVVLLNDGFAKYLVDQDLSLANKCGVV